MKIKQAFLLFFLITNFLPPSFSQVFQVAEGTISNTISDSRSANFFDVNNDGWEDIYISNGLNGGQPDFLYLNDGNGQMIEVTDQEIVEASNPSDGASFADYNNDGYMDGVVSSWHGSEDLLYLNNGDGMLNYNANAGIVSGSFAETAAFGDYDNDGLLDLYITNSGGDNRNYLYRNLGNDKFEQITNHILVNDTKLSRGAIWGDFNNDDVLDLFVANENNAANDIFIGQGGGVFEKLSEGQIVNSLKSSITGSWGDVDNDGDFDLFVGNSAYFSEQQDQLFLNTETGFENLENDPVVMANKCTYGSAFGDYDNDGDLDLMVTHGFCSSGLANSLYANQGDGTFADSSQLLASNFIFCSFGVAWGDVDNDGFLDLMVANCKNNDAGTEKANTLLMNQGNENHWLKIKLIGLESNRNAVGAKVSVKATINGNEVWQIREVRSQSGYAGQNSMIAHFGLGDATAVDSILVKWPAGGVQVLEMISINQKIEIEEGVIDKVEDLFLLKNLTINILPNPVSVQASKFQLIFNSAESYKNAKIEIMDSLGQLVWGKGLDVEKGRTSLEISNERKLSPGIYFVTILWDGRRLTERFVVQ